MRIAPRRSLGSRSNVVELIDPRSGDLEEILDVKPDASSGRHGVGELLLVLLGLSELFAPPEATALTAQAGRPAFGHLYPLCYLSQDMVHGGKSVRGSANSASSYKAVAELLPHLTDAHTRVLGARLEAPRR
jgi:hypothetical protein